MTLNFNSAEAPKHLYSGGDFNHKYLSGEISIYLKADTQNNIFRTRYLCHESLIPYFETLARFIQDKNLDDLIQNLSVSTFESIEGDELNKINMFDLELSLLHFREALLVYRGDLRGVATLDSENLVCRCMGIDLSKLRELVIKTKGEKAAITQESSLSLICGECTELFKESLMTIGEEEQLFAGKDFDVWKEEIATHLTEFHFYSPKEFSNVKNIKILELKLPAVELELVGEGEMPSERLARTSLANYLGQELKIPLDIKISFHNS